LEAVTILKSALGELQDALENTYGDRVWHSDIWIWKICV
jgi:hypothetical protein